MKYNNLVCTFAVTPETNQALKGKEKNFKKQFKKRVIELNEAK